MRFTLWLLAGLVTVMPLGAAAQGYAKTFSMAGGSVVVSNDQANSSWVPVSVLLSYRSAATGTAEVWRVSQDFSFQLAMCTFTNVTSVVWVPDVEYPFSFGDALLIRSSATNGAVQVIRKGG